ncbi:hypothetical protein [Bartonella acomydis]|uniref:Uncharacterized protein n=1 Tax=Bartonella acomydis TaxID=686234 RepID=A0ABP9N2S1_9HYPH
MALLTGQCLQAAMFGKNGGECLQILIISILVLDIRMLCAAHFMIHSISSKSFKEEEIQQTLKLLSVVILLIVIGCQFNKASSSSIGAWEYPGAYFKIGKALLECGMSTSDDVDPENQNRSFNQMKIINACML